MRRVRYSLDIRAYGGDTTGLPVGKHRLFPHHLFLIHAYIARRTAVRHLCHNVCQRALADTRVPSAAPEGATGLVEGREMDIRCDQLRGTPRQSMRHGFLRLPSPAEHHVAVHRIRQRREHSQNHRNGGPDALVSAGIAYRNDLVDVETVPQSWTPSGATTPALLPR